MSEIKIYPLYPVLIVVPEDGDYYPRTELLFVDFANNKVYNNLNNSLVDNQTCSPPLKLSEEELKKVLGVFHFDPNAVKMPSLADLIARKDSKQQYINEKVNDARKNRTGADRDSGGREATEHNS